MAILTACAPFPVMRLTCSAVSLVSLKSMNAASICNIQSDPYSTDKQLPTLRAQYLAHFLFAATGIDGNNSKTHCSGILQRHGSYSPSCTGNDKPGNVKWRDELSYCRMSQAYLPLTGPNLGRFKRRPYGSARAHCTSELQLLDSIMMKGFCPLLMGPANSSGTLLPPGSELIYFPWTRPGRLTCLEACLYT